MKKLVTFSILIIILTAFVSGDEAVYDNLNYDNFKRGEKLSYKVSFGIFSIGKGEMIINENFYRINKRDCYKIDVFGQTTGMVDWVAKVDDHWGAYVDSSALVPHIAYRNIKEGNYRKNEIVRFDHIHNVLETKVKDKKTGEWKEPILFGAPENVREMLSGYLYLRTMNFDELKIDSVFTISGFFEDMFYELNVRYRGKDEVKTKAGKFNAIKLEPIMPDNKLFDGEDSILAWISDDKNKIPLKVEAKMFIGNVGVELQDFENLKNPVNKVKD